MPARVYECGKSELEQLKKVLAYDPYLDLNLIPSSAKTYSSNEKLTDEQKRQLDERDKQVGESLRKISESPEGRIIFSRQEYNLKDGASLGLKSDTAYLFLNASEDFLNGAEERFRNEFKTIKRASKEEEAKVIQEIKEEQDRANAGFGSIFGN